MSLLDSLKDPDDLRALPESALVDLAADIRARLIETVVRTGGHLGPNLGVVELSIALHRVFCSPRDPILWDTGHQSYVHKMLTGRAQQLDGLRQAGGLSGYPRQAESAHDLIENSHASTALSYLDGLAKAFALRGETDRVAVAVVGDGALTGGMSWEALNNIAAAPHRPVVIVLNDNGRSYAPTVGALGAHLADLRGGAGGSVFEQLGLCYLGPVDGHDVAALESALRKARDLGCPTVVHCVTTKGSGYRPAETHEADRMHAINPPATAPRRSSWTDVFGAHLLALGEQRPDIVALSAAMIGPTGLQPFADRFPERCFDVGIAEQHAVTSAAGLAMGGLHPVVCVYATFLNRALDQVLMDVALHALPVTFVLDRAGITGTDGPSHHGMWDLSLLGTVPGMRVAAPRDAASLRAELADAVSYADGPSALRFPKADVAADLPGLRRVGQADVLREGTDLLLIAVGAMAAAALAAAEELDRHGVSAAVADPRWLLPVDPALVAEAGRYPRVVTIEDGAEHGGFGDAFARALRACAIRTDLTTLALPQRFLAHGPRAAILTECGLDGAGIVAGLRGCGMMDR